MTDRRLFVAVAALFVVTTLYFLRAPSFSDFAMSSNASPDVTPSDLVIKLDQASVNPPVLRITLKNTHPSSTATVLSWDTPLDPTALALGVFRIVDSETGEELKGPGLKINRLLPPPRDALVEVAPNSEVTQETELKGPWLPLGSNKKYKISALGAWKSVWPKVSSEVHQSDLDELGGENALKGYFKSEEVEITL